MSKATTACSDRLTLSHRAMAMSHSASYPIMQGHGSSIILFKLFYHAVQAYHAIQAILSCYPSYSIMPINLFYHAIQAIVPCHSTYSIMVFKLCYHGIQAILSCYPTYSLMLISYSILLLTYSIMLFMLFYQAIQPTLPWYSTYSIMQGHGSQHKLSYCAGPWLFYQDIPSCY